MHNKSSILFYNYQMRSILIIASIILICQVAAIYPPPRSVKLTGEYLHIPNICSISQTFTDDVNNKIFSSVQHNPEYYLNQILHRENSNIKCIRKPYMLDLDFQLQILHQANIHPQGYILQVRNQIPQIKITVNTYAGYVYALQTLSQMIKDNKAQIGIIEDSPLVEHRGIMIDSVRHFLSIETIQRLIRSMPVSKLNILHWHLSDDQAFVLRLNSHPELAESSAYKKGQFYTPEQVKSLISLGKLNAVKIVPEIDTPAHVRAWGLDNKWQSQNITIKCPKGEGYNAQFDVSKQVVYDLAQDVLKQVDYLFQDSPYIHLGGDQVFGACWDLRPAIKTFMLAKNIKTYGQLQMYWRFQMKQALPKGRKVVFWRNDAENLTTSADDIIHFWGATADIAKIVGKSESKVILSPSDHLYLNTGFGNIWFNTSAGTYSVWRKIYQQFQIFPVGVDRARILGGQVTLWGEVSNDATLQNNLWMRASSFAAKVWSQQKLSTANLVKGLVQLQKILYSMNVDASPITSQYCQNKPEVCWPTK